MKIKSLIITAVLAAAVLCFGVGANAQTPDIAVLIAQIKAQIAQLQEQLRSLEAQQNPDQAWCHTFNANIGVGIKIGNPEIDALKTVLQKEGLYDAVTSSSSEGGYGEALASAVTGFQEKYASEILSPYNLRHGTGFVGSATRAKLNSLYGCTIQPTCSTLYWLDNTDKTCASPKQFCGAYMYLGLKTFSTQQDCLNAVEVKQCTIDADCPTMCVACTSSSDSACGGCTQYKCVNGKCIPSTQPLSIRVVSPNGGETWQKGATQTIKWLDANLPDVLCAQGSSCMPPARRYNIKLVFYRPPCTGSICPVYSALAPYVIASNVTGASYSWTVGKVLNINSTVSDGAYTVQVCRSDTNDCDSSDSYFKIVDSASNLPPVISGVSGPTTLNTSQIGTWKISASDPENGILSYSVIWGDESVYPTMQSNGYGSGNYIQTAVFTHSYSVSGNYTPIFYVKDIAGNISKTSISVNVENKPQCVTDSDCPQIHCFVAPCPVSKCVDGKCVTPSPTCATNGQKVYSNPVFGPTQCCSKNAGIAPSARQASDMCVAPTDGSLGTCVENWFKTCGDGVCQNVTCTAIGCPPAEDKCNCPKDCSSVQPQCTIDSDCPQLCPTCGIGVYCPCTKYRCINGQCAACISEGGSGTRKSNESSKCCSGLAEQPYAQTSSYPISSISYRCIKPVNFVK